MLFLLSEGHDQPQNALMFLFVLMDSGAPGGPVVKDSSLCTQTSSARPAAVCLKVVLSCVMSMYSCSHSAAINGLRVMFVAASMVHVPFQVTFAPHTTPPSFTSVRSAIGLSGIRSAVKRYVAHAEYDSMSLCFQVNPFHPKPGRTL